MKYPLFRRLEVQLSLLTALCVVLTLLIFGVHLADKESQRVEQNIIDIATGMAAEVARLAANHIVLRDYAGLEKNLAIISFRITPLRDIMVTDAGGLVLSRVDQVDGEVRPRFEYQTLTTPDTRAKALEVHNESIIAWHPINLGQNHAWVRVRFSLAQARALQRDVYTNTAVVAVIASTLCALLLITFLGPRLRALKQLTDFAGRMDGQLGKQLSLPKSSIEVDTLADALNLASKTIADDQRALQASECRLRSVVENMPIMLVAFDAHGNPIVWNRECERVTGYTAGEVLANPAIAQRVCRDVPLEIDQLTTTERRGSTQGRELRVQNRAGETRIIYWTDISDRFPIPGWASWRIGLDVTDKAESERIKNDFIASVNHELRTPLTSIRASLRLLGTGVAGEIPPQAQDMLRIAERNTERLLRLVTDILDIQRMEAGAFHLSKHPVDVIELARETVQSNEPFARQRNVSLTLQVSADAAQVLADSDRLEQVITNLISNAVKHSSAGEAVITRVDRMSDRVRIEVKDSGPGIPKEFQSKIFGRFARADQSNARASSGTGLGLFISRTIIEQHDGIIGFASEPGKGTTFFIELPALLENAGAQPCAAS